MTIKLPGNTNIPETYIWRLSEHKAPSGCTWRGKSLIWSFDRSNPANAILKARGGRTIALRCLWMATATIIDSSRLLIQTTVPTGTDLLLVDFRSPVVKKSRLHLPHQTSGTLAIPSIPPAFQALAEGGLDEIVFFEDRSKDVGQATLHIVNLSQKRDQIIPQTWYPKIKNFDPGYTYLVDAIRSKPGGPIFGWGARLGFFQLTANGRTLSKWIVRDPFYLMR